MDEKRKKQREETDQDDQYSRPVCRSKTKPAGGKELGPNASQLLGILQSLENNDN